MDDDDALLPFYVEHILSVLRSNQPTPDFGFSAVENAGKISRRSLATGPMTADQPLFERLGGLGMAFWIRRTLFETVGGLDESIRVNEDTEFCLRLAEHGAFGWYETKPGVQIDAGVSIHTDSDAPSITKSSDLKDRARAFEYLLDKYSELLSNHQSTRRHFVERVLKYKVRSYGIKSALDSAKTISPDRASASILMKLVAWRLAYLLRKGR